MPWNPDFNKGFILVDVSYTVFYKFYALKNWFSLAHKELIPENQEEPVKFLDIPLFVEKYKKLYLEQLLKIAKKRKIPLSNIVFVTDCKQYNIWRHRFTDKYKATRAVSHIKQGFCDHGLFGITRELINTFVSSNDSVLFNHPSAEADDVIYILSEYIKTRTTPTSPTSPICIIASDADYLQICSKTPPILELLTMKGDAVEYSDSRTQLISKILMGDVSDNINACYLLTNRFPILESKKETQKVTKKTIQQLLVNQESADIILAQYTANQQKFKDARDQKKFLTLDDMVDDITVDSSMSRNQIIIDFQAIPYDIVNEVNSMIAESLR
jgi:hypothetical protein